MPAGGVWNFLFSPKLTKWFRQAVSFCELSIAALEVVKAGGAVMIVAHIVFAGPEHLYRCAHLS